MLICASRKFIPDLGFIIIHASKKYTFSPYHVRTSYSGNKCRLRYSHLATVLTALESVSVESTSVSLPRELSQLAKEVEESLEKKLFSQFPERYAEFRLLALEYSRDTRIPTDLLVALFPSLNRFYDTARMRLCCDPSKENAALHVMMYRDALILFRGSLCLEYPSLFAIELFESLLSRNAIPTAQNVFEHIKYLSDILPSESNTSFFIGRVDTWMDILASNLDLNAVTLLQRMVLCLPQCFGIQPSRKHHHHVLKALLKSNQVGRAWRWLERMQFHNRLLDEPKRRYWWTKLSHMPWFSSDEVIPSSSSIMWITTQTQDYDLFLTYFAKCGDFMSAKLLIRQMFILGPPVLPVQRSWHLYLLAAVSHAKSTVSAVISEMSEAGFNVSLTTLASLSGRGELQSWISEDILTLLRLEAQRRLKISGAEVVLDLLPNFKPVPLHSEVRTVEVKIPPHLEGLSSPDNRIASIGVLPGQASALQDTLPRGEEFGLSPNPFHITFQIPIPARANSQSQHMQAITSEDKEEPSATVQGNYTSTYRNADAHKLRRSLLKMSQTSNTANTIRTYHAYIALSGSRLFDIELGSALIRGLCRNALKAASKRNVFQAIKMYKDLLALELKSASPSFFTPSDGTLTIDLQEELRDVYHLLLRNLTAPITTSFSSAESLETEERCVEYVHYLLKEMELRGIAIDLRLIAPILLLQWRSTSSHEEALQLYMAFMSDIETSQPPSPTIAGPRSLDSMSFRSILNSFGKIFYQNAPITPARLWHVLLSHIRARGYVSTSRDYSLYLNNILTKKISPLALRYASLGMGAPEHEESMIKSMHDSLKYVFRQITIDIHISPDAVLFNTLINAFQRVGAFDDALQVFNLSWLTGQVDAVTPIIMFDACGYAKRPVEAYVIWNMLVRRRWKFDKRTLDTWVECLCRLGYVDQACKFVCLYMGKVHDEYDTIGDTKADVNTCLILLRLSWNFGQSLEVREKIKTHLPHIWKELSSKYM